MEKTFFLSASAVSAGFPHGKLSVSMLPAGDAFGE
jgi:hypothetical protein